ncbi:MAG: 30S ribosome-binding factor RbfA [Lentisphaeria bacterium]|nr:30S ribosome-binding factor RbfA [Lentisphaeria bacterium]
MPSNRMLRVNELIRRELGMLCESLVRPRTSALVTIVSVDTSSDLRHAVVGVSVFGSEEQKREVMVVMLDCRRQLQRELAKRVILKYTPVLRFTLDETAEQADHVLSILKNLELPEEDE